MRLLTTVLVLATAMAGAPRAAFADWYLHHWENRHEARPGLNLGADARSFLTERNFDANGELQTPASLNSYKRLGAELAAAFPVAQRLSAYARATWASVEVDHPTRGGSSYGFADQTLALSYRIFSAAAKGSASSGATIDLQFQADFAAYSNLQADAERRPYLGDGSMDLTGGAFLTFPLATSFSLTAGAGYTTRTDEFSASIPWSLVARYEGGSDRAWRLEAAALGLQSLNTDPRSVALLGSGASIATGGSLMGNAVNPSLLTARGRLGYALDPGLQLTASVSRALRGTSAPQGVDFGLGIEFRPAGRGTMQRGAEARSGSRTGGGFLSYAGDARVSRVNDRLNQVRIERGPDLNIERGQLFDIFSVKGDGTPQEIVARGVVAEADGSEATLSITEFYKEVWIEEGFIAKRLVQP